MNFTRSKNLLNTSQAANRSHTAFSRDLVNDKSTFNSDIEMSSLLSKTSLSVLLDTVMRRIQGGELADSVWQLVAGLRAIRTAASADEWAGSVAECLAHPIRLLLHQDPYSRRGFYQPRGYPGDAGLIDYLYLRGPVVGETVSELGAALHQATVRTPGGYSVRFRRDFVAAMIDSTAARIPGPAVLSVACGHLREAGRSSAVTDHKLGRFLAIDQDSESVRTVREECTIYGVEARCLTAAELMRAGDDLGRFNLVYALGLYDYLAVGPARMLTNHLFGLLAPGGTLLIANFVPGGLEAGYMEAFMRWHLIYRTPDELREVCDLIPKDEIAALDVWLEDARNIAYLSIVRN